MPNYSAREKPSHRGKDASSREIVGWLCKMPTSVGCKVETGLLEFVRKIGGKAEIEIGNGHNRPHIIQPVVFYAKCKVF